MPVEPTSFVREHAPWSISKINVAYQCAYKFHLQYVKKKRMGLPRGSEALVGTAIHKILEYALAGRSLSIAKKMVVNPSCELTTRELELVESFIPAVTGFLSRLKRYQRDRGIEQLILEQKLSVGFDGKPLGFWDNSGFLRGAVDLIGLFANKPIALIIDHKTGKTKPLPEYEWQFNAYLLLAKIHNPSLTQIQTGINHLQTETVDMTRGLSDVRDVATRLDAFMAYTNQRTRGAVNHLVTRKGPLCGWCDYQGICPAHRNNNGKKG